MGVIVARGASKRIPRKVVRPLLGAPLLCWAGQAAQASKLDRVIVSTEDEEIAEVARAWGFEVPFLRPEALAGDFIGPDAVLLHALEMLGQSGGEKFDVVALIQPTAPFISPEHINACLDQLYGTDACCSFIARQVSEPPQWMFRDTGDGTVELMIAGDLAGDRQHTQLVEPALLPAGAVWVVRRTVLERERRIYVAPMRAVVVARACAVDIDEEYDFIVAEAMALHHEFAPPTRSSSAVDARGAVTLAEKNTSPTAKNEAVASTEMLTCRPAMSIREILARIDRASPNLFQVVLDDEQRVVGTVTDGDIRRAMLASMDLDDPVGGCMNGSPRVATQADLDSNDVLIDMSFFLPVVDADGRLTQILTRQRHAGSIGRVLVMAGGFGLRLGEHTKQRPKPLLEVANKPILEHVLSQIEKAGIRDVHIAVHYLADQIAEFIGARNNQAHIQLINETEPMGTAGALSRLPTDLDGPVLVINGDVLTEVDLKALTEFHFRHGYDGTVGAAPFEVDIPYGVLKHDDSGLFTGIDEKPTHQYLVAGGIYLLSPRIVGLVSPNRPVDMPEILEQARSAGFRLGIFPVHEYWRDIGRPDDLKLAHDERKH